MVTHSAHAKFQTIDSTQCWAMSTYFFLKIAIIQQYCMVQISALGWVTGLKFCMCTMGHHEVVWYQFQPDPTAFYFMALNCVGGYLAIRYSHRAFQYTVLKPWLWGSQKYIAWPERVFSPTILEFEDCEVFTYASTSRWSRFLENTIIFIKRVNFGVCLKNENNANTQITQTLVESDFSQKSSHLRVLDKWAV